MNDMEGKCEVCDRYGVTSLVSLPNCVHRPSTGKLTAVHGPLCLECSGKLLYDLYGLNGSMIGKSTERKLTRSHLNQWDRDRRFQYTEGAGIKPNNNQS